MPKKVKFDGVVHSFPDDFTDAEISAALGAIPASNAAQAPKAKTWEPAGAWEDRGVAGKVWRPDSGGTARQRADSNVVGIDHDSIVHGIANWASGLSPSLQKPAAMLAAFPADALASLVEMLSAPESVASMGAGAPMDAAGRAVSATGRTVAAAPRAVVRGVASVADAVSPDVVGVVSPRVGKALELAQKMRSATRQAPTDATAPVIPFRVPTQAAPAQAAQRASGTSMTPAPLPQPARMTPAPDVAAAPVESAATSLPAAVGKALTFDERRQLTAWVKSGVDVAEAFKRIMAVRQATAGLPLSPAEAFAAKFNLPSSADVAARTAARNAAGTWK